MTSTATAHTTATSTDRALVTARHLINGEWLGDAYTERMNPARPGELAALSPSGTTADGDVSALVRRSAS
jgi:aldehyde dehydrogenase (NAD+)